MAVNVPIQALAQTLGVDVERATQLREVSRELVQRYAPSAPTAVANECCVRISGYLVEMPAAAVRSESVADVATSYAASHLSALRHSGAMALLSPWKVRRGGSV